MSRKPILVCAGFFPDRHAALLAELGARFELRYLDPDGRVEAPLRFPLAHHEPTPEDVRAAALEFNDVMESSAAAAGIAPPQEGRQEALRCLLETWMHGRDIALSLQRLHAATPVHAVLAVNDHLAPHRSLVEEARRLGIPSFYVEHGFQMCGIEGRHFKMPLQKTLPIADTLFVENELDRAYYEEFYSLRGGSRPKILCTGSALDHKSVVAGASLPGVAGGGRSRILFCPGWGEGNTLQWILYWDLHEHRAFHEFCAAMVKLKNEFPERRFEIVVKLHPTLTKAIGSDTSGYYREAAAGHGLECEVSDKPIGEWLAGADLQVSTMPSSVQWESFLHGVPSAAYLGEAWSTMLKGFPERVDTLITRWGAQEMLWDGCDWAGKLAGLLRKKWSGEVGRIRDEKLKSIEQVPADAAARRICDAILNRAEAPRKENGKMRILEIIHAFPPQDFGGTELYTLSLARALQKQGHEVHVLYPIYDAVAEPFSFREERYEDVTVIKFNAVERMIPPGSEMNATCYDKAFRAFLSAGRYDICHFQHLIFLSPNWPAIAKELGIPTALKIDDMYFTCMRVHLNKTDGSYCSGPEHLDKCVECVGGANPLNSPKTMAWNYYMMAHRRAVLRKTFAGFDFVQSASRFLVDHFRAFGFDNPNLKHIATGLNPFTALPRTKSPDGKIRVGYVGHVDPRKGIMVFLEAVAKYLAVDRTGKLSFHMHGAPGGDQQAVAIVHKTLQALKVVNYHGKFVPADRPAIFAGLDLMVVPSRGENYPFVIREAVTAGLPVVGTRIAGVPEIINPGVNGFLFDSNDGAALARIFLDVAANPKQLDRFQFPGFPAKYIDEEAAELAEIFAGLKGRRGGASAGSFAPAAASTASSPAAAQGGTLDVVVVADERPVDWKAFLAHMGEHAARKLSVTVIAPSTGHEALAAIQGIRVLRAGSPADTAATLRGALLAGAPDGKVVLMESNLRLPKGWDDRLVSAMSDGVSAVGPVSDRASGRQYAESAPGDTGTVETDWLVGLMMCLSRRAIAELKDGPDLWEQPNMALRLSRAIKRQGGKLLVTSAVFAGDWSGVPAAERAAAGAGKN